MLLEPGLVLALGRVREQGRGLALGLVLGREWEQGRGQEQGLVLGRVREQVLHKQPPDS